MRTLQLTAIATLVSVSVSADAFDLQSCMNAVVRRSDAAAKSASCPEFVRRTPADLRRDFGERVKVGDDRSKIEQALIELGLPFSWDRFSGRYQAVLGTPSSDFHAVVVHVYVDERQAYKSFEAIDSFTGP